MSFYDYNVNFETKRLLPPPKRKPMRLALMSVPGFVLQFYHDLFFTDYAEGAVGFTDWTSGGTYTYLQKVRYIDNAIYQLKNIVGITGITTAPDVDTANWSKVVNLFIGVRERIKYTGNKLMIEYALNRWFKTTFRQPTTFVTSPDMYVPKSDIYIQNTNKSITNFWLSNGNGLNSYMANNSKYQNFFLGNSYTYSQYDFVIFIPVAVYNALSADSTKRDGIIRVFADKYVQCDKTYKIQTY